MNALVSARFRHASAAIVVALVGGCEATDEPAGPGRNPAPVAATDAGTNAGGDASSPPSPAPATDASAVDSAAPVGKPVFVAAGHMGRTVMSCDGGLTWIHDLSDNDDARCWRTGDPNYVECDHTEFSSPAGGLTFGDGRFYASFGWGYNGSVRRTTDGAKWDVVKTGGWGGGVAYAKQTLLVVWEGGWSTSADRGANWKPVASTDSDGFDHPFPRSANDQFFVIGREAGAAKLGLSSDGAGSWSRPSGLSGSNGSHIAAGNGVIVATGGGNQVTRSTDNGQTWSSKEVLGTGNSWATNLLFDGSVFVAWAEGKKWTSSDGDSWSSTPFTIDGAAGSIYWGAATAVDPVSKNYVAFLNAWDNYYEKQKAYRSADGVTWTTLDAQHFKGGHPLSKIAFGRLDAPACP